MLTTTPPPAVVEIRDLSHPVHSDNCILNEATGECDKVPPAYTWRDYRSVEGGKGCGQGRKEQEVERGGVRLELLKLMPSLELD